jgi:hypothetical protein
VAALGAPAPVDDVVPRVAVVDGLLEVTWPAGRPDSFRIASDFFELVVAELNGHRADLARARAARAGVNGAPVLASLEGA